MPSITEHSAFRCLNLVLAFILPSLSLCWLPDTTTKLVNNHKQLSSISFLGNSNASDHFVVLYQDKQSILLGGMNRVYNLSIYDLTERPESNIFWNSSDAHEQLCILKGKTDSDCQNYIRILFRTSDTEDKFIVCGTNSYKPLCRNYSRKNGNFAMEKETEGKGLCPYDPEHNSTAIYSNDHLFAATMADFSGGDPLIYRDGTSGLRTEISDFKQLNAPNFVSSLTYNDYVYFFFRETAVEFMNCGKVIYSRVARVCKHDKGGPRLFKNRWTTFLKARLNCSVPGEYPFYFDEIQSTSEVIEGNYGSNARSKVVYGALTTPNNAISGSAICLYQMEDMNKVFQGAFKQQDSINSNWLPVPQDKVPTTPRPGECVQDSRILQDANVNFIKTHSLMEEAVPALFGRPILIKVSLHYRFTSVTVDPQVPTDNNRYFFDVLYIGTDDGKIIKAVNIPSEDSAKGFVISENEVFPLGSAVKQLKLAPGYGRVVAVSEGEVKLVTLNHCASASHCAGCVELRDPHCAWDTKHGACVSVDAVTSRRFLIQDVRYGEVARCRNRAVDNDVAPKVEVTLSEGRGENVDKEDPLLIDGTLDDGCNEVGGDSKIRGCAVQNRLNMYTSEYLHIFVATASLAGLFVGFLCGYFVSRRFQNQPQYPNSAFIEQHNHLDRSVNQNSFLASRKQVNLVLNVSNSESFDTLPPKKDNLGSTKNLNITNEGTLQKIKKTYI
ncbi:unnamed protein product [Brassicogethes aeneus]|uniref:Sema domain-containing protein n=1 Tax=Brassicogethes aeneus TaxID=1431903 RepID=A0A9P0FM65_BRAAE|nr:unnamed protein product [Brassicogethes aeneus]